LLEFWYPCAEIKEIPVHAFGPMASGELEAHHDSEIFAACSHDYGIKKPIFGDCVLFRLKG